MKDLERKKYLGWLRKQKNQPLVKVITGVRGCGKTALLRRFQEELAEENAGKARVLVVDLESPEFEDLTDCEALNRYLETQIEEGQSYFVFLDEIQHIENWEATAAWLLSLGTCDLYVSSSCLWEPGKKAFGLLEGKWAVLEMQPLSFREYQDARGKAEKEEAKEALQQYTEFGSFPYLSGRSLDREETREYLRGLYHTILLNDVVKRQKIADAVVLEAISRFLMYEIGVRTSPAAIANAMAASGRKVDQKTVDRYLQGLTESQLFYEVRRYHIKTRKLLTTMNKFYLCDPVFGRMMVRQEEKDWGRVLENLVFLELKRRYSEVYNGQLGASTEIDFVAIRDGRPVYFQVAESTKDPAALSEKLTPLQQIRDNYPKYLLTMDEQEADYEGILQLNLVQWMKETV